MDALATYTHAKFRRLPTIIVGVRAAFRCHCSTVGLLDGRVPTLFAIAFGAPFLAPATGALAACTPDGTTLNCTGDITGDLFHNGFFVSSATTYTTYNFFDVTDPVPIQPDSGYNGIYVRSKADATDLVVTTDAAIHSTGAIAISLDDYDGFITLENSGDLEATSSTGIYVFSKENTTPGVSGALVTNHGNITADLNGLWARATEGDVTVINTGAITAIGESAINAQTNGNASITTSGDLAAEYAIYARGSGTNDVTLQSGTIYGDTYGVYFIAGTTNTLNNSATLSGGLYAVYGAPGDDIINNSGTIIGDISLRTGANAFNNLVGGAFNPGATVSLGPGNTLTNSGVFSPGDTGLAQQTMLTGNFEQTGTGNFIVDVDEGGTTESDFVSISGTATFGGTITPNVLNITNETGSVTIVTAAALTSTASVVNTGDYDFSLYVDGGTDLVLSWEASKAILELLINANANQYAIAAYLDALDAAGPSSALEELYDALVALGEQDLIAAIDQLLPEVYSNAQAAMVASGLGFADNLLSCRVQGSDAVSINHEGQCLWGGVNFASIDLSATPAQQGVSQTVTSASGGMQFALAGDWRMGVGLGYGASRLTTSTGATSDGTQVHAGVALKYNPGPLLLAATASYSHGWYDSRRPVSIGAVTGTAAGDPQIDAYTAGLRIAYAFGTSEFYFKPALDAFASRVEMNGFTETGVSAANLTVADSSGASYRIAPSVEIGGSWDMPANAHVRTFLKAGFAYNVGEFPIASTFAGETGIAPFVTRTELDELTATLGAGLDLFAENGATLRASYSFETGERITAHSVGLKASIAF